MIDNIYRIQGTHNTNVNTKTRLGNKITFAGAVPIDGQIVIIDDNYTSGNTIIALMQHIQDNGGKTALVSTLSASRYGKGLKVTQDKIKQLIDDVKLPVKEIESIMGHSLQELTNAKINLIRLSTRQRGASGLRQLYRGSILERGKQEKCDSNEGKGVNTSQDLDSTKNIKQQLTPKQQAKQAVTDFNKQSERSHSIIRNR